MTKSIKPYLEYRDSSVPWLGPVPAHWEVLRLKRFTRLNPSKTELLANGAEKVTFLPMEKISSSGRINTSLVRRISEVRSGFTCFRENDVILAKITPCFENGKSAVARGLENEIGFGSTEFHVLRSSLMVLPEFLYRLVSFSEFLSIGEENMEGAAGQKRIPVDFVANFQSPLPLLDEQCAIVDFLDGMDARITRFIAARRKMIALLEEKKQAVINQAVTRGLDPGVPMKDSGVDWLGEIPVQWTARRLRSIAHFITSGSRDWAKCYADEGAIFIRLGNLSTKSVELKLSNLQYVQPQEGAEGERTRVLPNDILISITAQMGAVGLVPDGLGEAYINQHTALVRLRLGLTFPPFVAYFLLSDYGKQQSHLATNGGTKLGLGLDDVANLVVMCPPNQEQQAIVEYINRVTSRIDSLIVRHRREIELMQEYRTRLISDVVTGKLDVRGVELPAVEAITGEEIAIGMEDELLEGLVNESGKVEA